MHRRQWSPFLHFSARFCGCTGRNDDPRWCAYTDGGMWQVVMVNQKGCETTSGFDGTCGAEVRVYDSEKTLLQEWLALARGQDPDCFVTFQVPCFTGISHRGTQCASTAISSGTQYSRETDDQPRSCNVLNSDYAVGWDAASRQSSSPLIQLPGLPIQSSRQWRQSRDFGFMSYLAIHLW